MDLTILLSLLSLFFIGYTTWTNAYEYNTFAATVTSIGGNEGTIMIASEQAVTDNLIIPTNITLRFIQGGTLNISLGKIVTINGHVEAGLYQIFEGDGSVTFGDGAVKEIFPQWWGAKADGVTDATTAIQAAIDSIASGGLVFFSQGAYLISDPLEVSVSEVILRGCGKSSYLVTASTTENMVEVAGPGVDYEGSLKGVIVEKLGFRGPNSGTGAAIYCKDIHECTFRDNWIGEKLAGTGYGIEFDGSGSNDVDNNLIANNHITWCASTAIYLHTTTPLALEENSVIGNIIAYAGGNGISCSGSRNTIIGNTIEESTANGIVIDDNYNTVVGNTVCECTEHGISVESAGTVEGVIISNNIVKDNDFLNTTTFNGINLVKADKCIIMGNTCRDNDNYEISLDANSDDNIIVGNYVDGADHVGTIDDNGAANLLFGNPGSGFDGTWTPVDASGAALGFTSAEGVYSRVGRIITLAFDLTYPATADGSVVAIGGLPFTSEAGTAMWGGPLTYQNSTIELQVHVNANATTFTFRKNDGSVPTNANLSTKILRGVITYRV